MKKILLIIATIILVLNCNAQTVTDIDGNEYNTVNIGAQVWMKENLKTTHYRNGDSIGTTYPATLNYSGISSPKYQWAYNGKDSLAAIYGRLYTWYAATDNRKVCPVGWHVPTKNEFVALDNYLGGASVAKGKLKETGNEHWNSPNSDATDAVGFTGLPGGSHWPTGEFVDMGIAGHYWASNLEAPGWAYRMLLTNNIMDAQYHINSAEPTIGWAVRCLEDPIPDSAKYFGQTPPGDKAVKFAPDIISLPDRMEYKVAFSPDGKECFINVGEGTGYKVYSTKRVNNSWTEQTVAPFSANQSTEFSSFSVDGNKVFFEIAEDIWISERTNTGWNEAQKLSSPVNTLSHESGYSETADSTIYFTSDRPGSIISPFYKNLDIWTINKTTNQAENLGNIINSSTWDVTSCIAPDGSYLIYTKGDGTTMGLFISFKKEDSSWTTPLNMDKSGTKINILNLNQNSPSLSPDGKYLFFNRHDQNSADIYWVSTSIIDTLKNIALTDIRQIEKPSFGIHPNPTNGSFTLSLGATQNHELLVEIYNLQGTLIISKTLQNTASANIDLTGNKAGIYVVKVVADGACFDEKILKR